MDATDGMEAPEVTADSNNSFKTGGGIGGGGGGGIIGKNPEKSPVINAILFISSSKLIVLFASCSAI